jgi:hypothetical protein
MTMSAFHTTTDAERRHESAISERGGMARARAICKGLKEIGDRALAAGVLCETCKADRQRATTTSFTGGKFLHRCDWCLSHERTVRTAHGLTTAPRPAPSARNAGEYQRLARAASDEPSTPRRAAVRPACTGPDYGPGTMTRPRIVPTLNRFTPNEHGRN